MAKRLSSCPGWLHLTDDRSAFVFDPNRAEIVKRIFEETIAGVGAHAIARRFNEFQIPPFGPAPYWQHSTISNILSNRATLGEYTPVTWHNRHPVGRGDPVANYYPAVVDVATFEKAALARRRHFESGRGGQVSNLFPSMMSCAYCSGPIKFENVSARASPGTAGQYYVCSRALKQKACARVRWSRGNFESDFLKFLKRVSVIPETPFSKIQDLANFRTSDDEYLARSTFASSIKQTAFEIRVAVIGDVLIDEAVEKQRCHRECRDFVDQKRNFTVSVAGSHRWRFEPHIDDLSPAT